MANNPENSNKPVKNRCKLLLSLFGLCAALACSSCENEAQGKSESVSNEAPIETVQNAETIHEPEDALMRIVGTDISASEDGQKLLMKIWGSQEGIGRPNIQMTVDMSDPKVYEKMTKHKKGEVLTLSELLDDVDDPGKYCKVDRLTEEEQKERIKELLNTPVRVLPMGPVVMESIGENDNKYLTGHVYLTTKAIDNTPETSLVIPLGERGPVDQKKQKQYELARDLYMEMIKKGPNELATLGNLMKHYGYNGVRVYLKPAEVKLDAEGRQSGYAPANPRDSGKATSIEM